MEKWHRYRYEDKTIEPESDGTTERHKIFPPDVGTWLPGPKVWLEIGVQFNPKGVGWG